MSKTRIMRQTKTEEIVFFVCKREKNERSMEILDEAEERDRCHLFYINVNDWCMTLKCSTFLWKLWLLVGLNDE